MPKLLAALLLAALAIPLPATAAPYAYAMTGEAFARLLEYPDPANLRQKVEREKTMSYLDGLKDATQGRVWCDIDQLKTPDMAYDFALEISAMAPAARKGPAAPLLLALLSRKYPCGRKP
jgi:hypothetical protein